MADWPERISDGLTLPCCFCGTVPRFDWTAIDQVWKKVIPSKHPHDVVCLPCFEVRAVKANITCNYITRIQFIGIGRTWDFREPGCMYVWSEYA